MKNIGVVIVFLFLFVNVFSQKEGGIVYEVEAGVEEPLRYKINLNSKIYAMAVSNDGQSMALATSGKVFISRIQDGLLENTIDINLKDIRGLCFTPDGNLGVAASNGIALFKLPEADTLWVQPLSAENENASRIHAGHDGNWLYTSSKDDGVLYRWSAADGSAGPSIETPLKQIDKLDVSRNFIAVNSAEGVVVMDFEGEVLWHKEGDQYEGPLAFSPDDRWLALSSIGMGAVAQVFEIESGEEVFYSPMAGDERIGGLAWSPDKMHLFTAAGGDGKCPVIHWTPPAEMPDKYDKNFRTNLQADNAAIIGEQGGCLILAGEETELRVYRIE